MIFGMKQTQDILIRSLLVSFHNLPHLGHHNSKESISCAIFSGTCLEKAQKQSGFYRIRHCPQFRANGIGALRLGLHIRHLLLDILLIKRRRKLGIFQCRKDIPYMARRRPLPRKRLWDRLLAEEGCFRSLIAWAAVTIQDFASENYFIRVKNLKGIHAIGIIDSDHPAGFDMESGFFPYFAFCGLGGSIPNVGPTAGHRPSAINPFADHKQFLILEYGSPDIDLWGCIANLNIERLK
jgi:hypothetical protein